MKIITDKTIVEKIVEVTETVTTFILTEEEADVVKRILGANSYNDDLEILKARHKVEIAGSLYNDLSKWFRNNRD